MLHVPVKSRVRNYLRGTFLRKIYQAPRHRDIRPEDTFLAGYSRCGSAWLAFMLSQTVWRDGDAIRMFDQRYIPTIGNQAKTMRRLPNGGRLIASHEQYRREYQHAICVLRDPRDAAVSTYYHVQRVMGVQGSFSEFLPVFLKGVFNGCGRWGDHVQGWLDCPLWDKGQAIWVRYEDIKADPARELRRAVEFLGYQPTEQEIAAGVDAGRFDKMREREKTTKEIVHREAGEKVYAVRKGVVGDWQNHFSAADLDLFYRAVGPVMTRVGYSLEEVAA